jgi:Poly(ADP-ribose) polymerase and DNA-Ligase Zn-finger region
LFVVVVCCCCLLLLFVVVVFFFFFFFFFAFFFFLFFFAFFFFGLKKMCSKVCEKPIDKGELRIGKRVIIRKKESFIWFHTDCYFSKFVANKVEDWDGFEELKDADKEKLKAKVMDMPLENGIFLYSLPSSPLFLSTPFTPIYSFLLLSTPFYSFLILSNPFQAFPILSKPFQSFLILSNPFEFFILFVRINTNYYYHKQNERILARMYSRVRHE